MNPITGLLIVTVLISLIMLSIAFYHLWEMSELKYEWQNYQSKRAWNDTKQFINKIKEVRVMEKGILETSGSGRRYVKDCVTGNLIPIEKAREIGYSKGHWYWIDKHRDITDIPKGRNPIPSTQKEVDRNGKEKGT